MKQKNGGYFVISIDFELFWGMFDKVTLEDYGAHVRGEQQAVPRMLTFFKEYGVHATWATVGMLMARNKDELCSLLPQEHLRPRYSDVRMSAYSYITNHHIGNDEHDDPYHFGHSLVQTILKTPFQEIANHTFSHFYCIDGHHNEPAIFKADLDAHKAIADTYDIQTTSIVFPRNQMDTQALNICSQKGLVSYRGTEKHFLYRPRRDAEQSLFVRGLRLIDHYLNLSGHHTYPLPEYIHGRMINIPASRFLRPWSTALRFFESLKVARITKAMTHAAKHSEVFHLWWHPHNFGVNQEQNFQNLKKILEHYVALKQKYGMQSMTMDELAQEAIRVASE